MEGAFFINTIKRRFIMSFSRALKEKTKKIWEDGYNHPFVQGLGSGNLDNLEGNFYRSWIESYAGDEFKESFDWFYDEIDRQCKNKTEEELIRLEEIFEMGVQMEYLFWDMAYKQKMSY